MRRARWLRGSRLLLWALLAGPGPLAVAQQMPPALSHGEILYLQHCTACHGARASGDGPREIPALAGQQEAYLASQLARFAGGQRAGSAMHGRAMSDTLKATDVDRPAAIADLAAYLKHLPAAPGADRGPGTGLEAARQTYLDACAGCHGADGAGGGAIPRLAGQHFRYLLSRLREFGAVHGGGTPAPAAERLAPLADLLARLPAGGRAP